MQDNNDAIEGINKVVSIIYKKEIVSFGAWGDTNIAS